MKTRGTAVFLICVVVAFLATLHYKLPREQIEIVEPEAGCYIIRAYWYVPNDPERKHPRAINGRNRQLFEQAIANLERRHGRPAEATFIVMLPVRLPDGSVMGQPIEMMVFFRKPGLDAPAAPADDPLF